MKKPPKIRLAVVGCGAVAAIHHLPGIAASDVAEAAVLVDADEKRARALAERWGVPAVVTDYREVVGRVDAAVVALPNHLHAPVAGDLLRRGVHVLVEKPMALTGAECGSMIEAAEAGRAVLAVGLEFRFFDSSRLIRDLLAGGTAGIVGPLRRFEMRQGVIPRWPFATDYLLRKEMSGGGVLMDFGVHVLDLLLSWIGDWESVRYRDDAMGGVESDCEIELTMRSGLTGFVEISRTRNLANTCRFEGEKGTLEVGIWDPDPEIAVHLNGQEMLLSGRARRPGPRREAGLEFSASFVRQIDDFAGAIREGREPRVSGREGKRSMDLIDACYAARQPLVLPWIRPPQLAEARA